MIHKLAAIQDGAKIANDVEIGPFTYIGSKVTIGKGCKIHSNVVIDGTTTIGENNEIFQFASIGDEPIDRSFKGEEAKTIIGDNNIIRECVTIHSGTSKENNTTILGNNNLIMNYVHIGHDCVIGNNVTLVGYCGLAGHVRVEDFATIGFHCGVHQFARVGAYSFIAHAALVTKDVPPYLMVIGGQGQMATPMGLNLEGLKRKGFSKESISAIKKCYRLLYRNGLKLQESLIEIEKLKEETNESAIDRFIDLIKISKRGIIR